MPSEKSERPRPEAPFSETLGPTQRLHTVGEINPALP